MISHRKVSRLVLALGFLVVYFHTALGQVSAQVASPNVKIDVTPKQLLVGDTVTITMRVFSHEDDPITLDHKITLQIRDQKPGQQCTTTDGTLLGDGAISGYCTSTSQPGNMEIWAETSADTSSTYQLNGEWYTPHLSARVIAEFRDPKEFCAAGPVAPGSLVLLKQNDVSVKVEWQHTEKFLGTYEVLYGTKYGEYPHKRQTLDKNLIVDGLDPRQTYFFTVQAQSPCKWTAASGVMQYVPLTGSVSAAKQMASPKATPKTNVNTQEKQVELVEPIPTESTTSATVAPSTFPELVAPNDAVLPPKTLSRTQRLMQAVAAFFQKLKFW